MKLLINIIEDFNFNFDFDCDFVFVFVFRQLFNRTTLINYNVLNTKIYRNYDIYWFIISIIHFLSVNWIPTFFIFESSYIWLDWDLFCSSHLKKLHFFIINIFIIFRFITNIIKQGKIVEIFLIDNKKANDFKSKKKER